MDRGKGYRTEILHPLPMPPMPPPLAVGFGIFIVGVAVMSMVMVEWSMLNEMLTMLSMLGKSAEDAFVDA